MRQEAMKMQGVLTVSQTREYERQAKGGPLYAELSAAFEVARKREATARLVDTVHRFASIVLQAPRDHTAHAVDLATGLLDEITKYIHAEMAATGKTNV